MNKLILSRADEGLLVLRVAFGLMMMAHGWQKLQGWSEMSGSFADPFGIGPAPSLAMAIFAELGCSIALLLGLLTRLAVMPLIVTMLVAIFYAHGADPWQKKEMAVAYLAVYATILVAGPGRYSVDQGLFGTKARRTPDL